jgi:hypothetical protein
VRVIAVLALAIVAVTLLVLGPRLLGQGTDVIVRGLRSDEDVACPRAATGSCGPSSRST